MLLRRRLDDTIRAARHIGIRFHPVRGAMSRGVSQGGIPPDELVEQEPNILADMRRCIGEYHDNSRCHLQCSNPSPGSFWPSPNSDRYVKPQGTCTLVAQLMYGS